MANIGKHSKEAQKIRELEETIKLKDQEIKDIKVECAEQFKKIKEFCTCNDYNGTFNRIEKINEVASDNFTALVKDLLIDKEETKAKIIELPNTDQSNK